MERAKEVNTHITLLFSFNVLYFLSVFREEEGIELQVLSNKPVVDSNQQQNGSTLWMSSYAEFSFANTDVDSVESDDFHRIEPIDQKQTSTIGSVKSFVLFILKKY